MSLFPSNIQLLEHEIDHMGRTLEAADILIKFLQQENAEIRARLDVAANVALDVIGKLVQLKGNLCCEEEHP